MLLAANCYLVDFYLSHIKSKMDKISDLLNSDIPMQPRVERLNKLLGNSLYESLLWGDDYSTELIDEALKRRIRTGHFQRLVFYGMGCSSVVSDVMKAFLLEEKLPLEVEVVNDYSFEWFTSPERLCSDTTLSIIVCYSGWSVEPILFYEKMKEMTGNRNLIVFSAGGKIASIAKKDGVALVQYRLRHADREYPLYHVQQFFSVFVNFFYDLGLLNSNYQAELEDTVSFLKSEFDRSKIIEAKEMLISL
jgi:glucose/mannose-6-phosphate isomerase